jgi:hypothetical protein
MIVAEADCHCSVVPVYEWVVPPDAEQTVLREPGVLDELPRGLEPTSRRSVLTCTLCNECFQRILNTGVSVRMHLATVRNEVGLVVESPCESHSVVHDLIDRVDWFPSLAHGSPRFLIETLVEYRIQIPNHPSTVVSLLAFCHIIDQGR